MVIGELNRIDELSRVARAAATAGAEVALGWHARAAELGVREKTGPRDLVSQADLDTEQAIRQVLADRRPGDAVLGEEQGRTPGGEDVEWLVDPIDGTTSYLYGRADWSVSVAARGADGRMLVGAVAEPSYGRLTTAAVDRGTWIGDRRCQLSTRSDLREALIEVNFGRPHDQHPRAGAMVAALLPRVRDLRRGGSAASSLANVATGRADAAWSPGLQPWDGAAGIMLVLEAGGIVGDLDGPSEGRWPASGDVLAAPAGLWEPIRAVLAEVYTRS
jgi:myo-inositol-1(or 4)-monophosphatase